MAELSPNPDILSEAELANRASARDPHAVRLIIRRHNQRLFRIARSILRDDSEAEDVLQEAYCHAFAKLGTFRGESQLGTWLARIVINEALGRLRRRRPTEALTGVEAKPQLVAQIIPFPTTLSHVDPEEAVAQSELRAVLERAIDNLPEPFRTVLVARLVEGMTTEETAELFGILPETVKTRLHRGRRLLQDEIEKHFGSVLNEAFPFAGRRCERLTEAVLDRLGLR